MVGYFYASGNRFSLLALLSLVLMPAMGSHAAAPTADPPLPPQPTPYTELFRRLLAAPEVEQMRLLTNKVESVRVVLQNKLREYKAIPPEECERRLRALDLRYYLSSLIQLPRSNRLERLAAIPERDRGLVEERLRAWELLPPPLQKEVTTNDTGIFCLVGVGLTRNEVWRPKRNIDQAFQEWQAVPEKKRAVIYGDLNRILTPGQPPLSDWERQKIRAMLPELTTLSPEQRSLFRDGIRKYLALSQAQREEFFRNAARWQKMSDGDRQLWSELVQRLPPMPPGLMLPPHPSSSLPPALPRPSTVDFATTNQANP